MAKGFEVLAMLLPDKGWAISGDDYNSIQWLECEPITKEEFEAGFAQYDEWKTQEETPKAEEKAALLARLGITDDEAKLLLS